MRQKVIRFYHQMRNLENNEVAATTILTGVHLDCTRRKACLFPRTDP